MGEGRCRETGDYKEGRRLETEDDDGVKGKIGIGRRWVERKKKGGEWKI
jgi:hypothetical protein